MVQRDASTYDEADEQIRVAVVSPYPAIRAGLRAMLSGADRVELTGFGDPETDLLVIGVTEDSGAVPERAVFVGAPALVRSIRDKQSGPSGFLSSEATADQLYAAVLSVASGLTVTDSAVSTSPSEANGSPAPNPLTAREMDVLRLIGEGLPNKAIAQRLGISENTVKFHAGSILGKLDAASRAEAIASAIRGGLLPV